MSSIPVRRALASAAVAGLAGAGLILLASPADATGCRWKCQPCPTTTTTRPRRTTTSVTPTTVVETTTIPKTTIPEPTTVTAPVPVVTAPPVTVVVPVVAPEVREVVQVVERPLAVVATPKFTG